MDETTFIKGPDFDIDLSFLDVYLQGLYSYRILCFATPPDSSHASMISTLKTGLQRLVNRCPILGGVVETLPNSQIQPPRQRGWKAARPGPGIELVVKDLTGSMDFAELEAREFPLAALPCDVLIPVNVNVVTESTYPASKFQLSCIKGGALLAVCMVHLVSDGNGMNTLMRTLAEECGAEPDARVELNGELVQLIGMDRSPSINLPSGRRTDPKLHPGYMILPDPELPAKPDGANGNASESDKSEVEAHHAPPPEVRHYMFQILPEKIAELKAFATPPGRRISTHDAISALIWRSVMLSRLRSGTIDNEEATVTSSMPTDARRHVSIPAAYVGNCVYFSHCEMRLGDLLQPDSLPRAAAAIRESLNSIDREAVEGLNGLVKSLPHVHMFYPSTFADCLRYSLPIATSWVTTAMYGDWGPAFGEVKRFRCPDTGFLANIKGNAFVCPRVGNTGPAEVTLWLEEEGLKALQKDELFTKFFKAI